MGKNAPKWLPGERIDETILLQRKSVEELKADSILRKDKRMEMRSRHKAKIDMKRKRKLETKKFISAQSILKYAQRNRHQARKFHKIGEKTNNSVASSTTASVVELYPVALLVRAKGNLIPKDVRKTFEKLGLQKLYSARFVHLKPENLKIVRQLTPFSIIGYPDAQQIDKLIRTRGCVWNEESGAKRFINGNRLVEAVFGQYNIICIEDLVDAVVSKSEHIDKVLSHLAAFDFHPPRQLFAERHRSAHEKLEIVNPESFAAYLKEQLMESEEKAKQKKRVARTSAAQARKTLQSNDNL